MRKEYQTMYFGRKGDRIQVLHLRKPIRLGLAGMVSSKQFGSNIALVVADTGFMDFDFACLGYAAGGTAPRILMTREIFYDFKRGSNMARMIVFHEIGHYCNKDHFNRAGSGEEANAARIQAVSSGVVDSKEAAADHYAVRYLGKEAVVAGLREIRQELQHLYGTDEYDAESYNAAITELDLRINVISKAIR